jgi:hypothetical protein
MISVAPKQPGAPWLTPQRDAPGAQPAAHRLARNANGGSDALERHFHGLQSGCFLIARLSPCIRCLAAPLGCGWFDRFRHGCGHAGGQGRRLVRDLSAHAPNIGMVTSNNGLNG